MATNLQKIGSYFRSRLKKSIAFGFKYKKSSLLIMILAVLVIGFLVVPSVNAASVDDPIGMLMDVVNWLAYTLVSGLGWLVMRVFGLIIVVASYNDFINHPAVAKGWYLMRDICNMFFILILLVIAFSTILRVEKYEIKKMLPTVVMAAVLVNFSKLICSLIIDFGQVVMMTFVNGFVATAGGNLLVGLGIQDIYAISPGAAGVGIPQDVYFVTLLLGGLMMAVTLWVSVSMLILLVIRIVTLWFLVVTAPLAFLLKVMPFTSKHYGEWWQKFGWNVAVGPVFAFFLWLSLLIMSDPNNMFDVTVPDVAGRSGAPEPSAAHLGNLGRFAIAVGMLWSVYTVAKEAGGAISSIGGKLASTGIGIGKSTAMRWAGGNYVKGAVDSFKKRGAAKDQRQQAGGALIGARMSQGKEYAAGKIKKGLGFATGAARTIGESPYRLIRGQILGKRKYKEVYKAAVKDGKNSTTAHAEASDAANEVKKGQMLKPWQIERNLMGRDNLDSSRMIGNEVQAAKNKEATEKLNNSGYDLTNKDHLRDIIDDPTRSREEQGIAYQKLAEEAGMGGHGEVKAGRKALANNKDALKSFNEAVEQKQLHMAYDFNDEADVKKYQAKVKAEKIDVTKISEDTAKDEKWQKATMDALGADTYAKKMSKVSDRSEDHAKAIDEGVGAMMATQIKLLNKRHDAAKTTAAKNDIIKEADKLRDAVATITLDTTAAYSVRDKKTGKIPAGTPVYSAPLANMAVKFINKASHKQLGNAKIDDNLVNLQGHEIQEAAIHRMGSSDGVHAEENLNKVVERLLDIYDDGRAGTPTPGVNQADLVTKLQNIFQNTRTNAAVSDSLKTRLAVV
jgi:hypothetical protein